MGVNYCHPLITDKSILGTDLSIEGNISKLNSNEVHGVDMISIRMLKGTLIQI